MNPSEIPFDSLLLIYLLSYFYFKDRGYSVLISVISIFLVHFNLGGNALITPYLTPNMMSSIFILFSLNLLLRGKTIPGYLSLGIATLLHPMIGLVMYGTFVFVHIFQGVEIQKMEVR